MRKRDLSLLLSIVVSTLIFGCFVSRAEVITNLVANAGFEERAADGGATGWRLPKSVYSVVDEQSRSGDCCLQYENDDASLYVLSSVPVDLEPGKRYELEVWVRTENISGEDSGATICLEWSDENGKYIGGAYPKGIKGTTTEWQCVYGTTRPIPDAAATCQLVCYVRKGMTGRAWFDDVRLRMYRPPIADGITSTSYRDIVSSEPFEIRVGLQLSDWELSVEDVELTLRIENEKEQTITTIGPAVISSSMARFPVEPASLKPGTYTARVQIRAPGLQAPFELTKTISKRAVLVPRKAYIDRHRRLILNGKPFFPLGMYWGTVKEDKLDIYAASSFNCLMPYGAPDRETMDRIHAKGLKVIYSIKDYYAGTKWCPPHIKTSADEEPAVRQTVSAYKDHPALMAWYINDELPVSMIDRLSARRDLMEELDPDHPTWVVLYQVADVRRYLPSFDVIGTDPYPIPNRPVSLAGDWTRMTVEGPLNCRAVWMVPQVFDWRGYKKAPEDAERYRAPTLLEMRSMAWQCIAEGANGLVFYSWFDLWKMDKTDSFAARWAEVTTMVKEIEKYIPVVLSVAPAPKIVPRDVPASVLWRVWRFEDSDYLLAVNSTSEHVCADFEFQGILTSVDIQVGVTSPASAGKRLSLTFSPLEPKLIRLQSTVD